MLISNHGGTISLAFKFGLQNWQLDINSDEPQRMFVWHASYVIETEP